MSDKKTVYLDYNASTPLDPLVLNTLYEASKNHYANASNFSHQSGKAAARELELARCQIADAIQADEKEIIFTSGATESINLAIKGVARFYASKGRHIITTATEHRATLDTCDNLQKDGFEISILPVDHQGKIDPDDLKASIRKDTLLVSIMSANNEIGTMHDLSTIGQITRQHGVFFHVDAAQTISKHEIQVKNQGIDLLSCSAHKIYGPKGIGALYVSRKNPRVRLEPLMHGGSQEQGRRSGTVNTPAIMAFSKAVQICKERRTPDNEHLQTLSGQLLKGLEKKIGSFKLNGPIESRLPGNINISIPGIQARDLLCKTPDVAMSLGAACSTGLFRPSHVLKAIGLSEEQSNSAIRLSVGRFTKTEDVKYAIHRIAESVRELRHD